MGGAVWVPVGGVRTSGIERPAAAVGRCPGESPAFTRGAAGAPPLAPHSDMRSFVVSSWLASWLSGCVGDAEPVTLADLRGIDGVEVHVSTTTECRQVVVCFPIIDDEYLVEILHVALDAGAAGDVELREQPVVTVGGATAHPRSEPAATLQEYSLRAEASWPREIVLTDSSDAWRIVVGAPEQREAELVVPVVPPPDESPMLRSGDSIAAVVVPAPPAGRLLSATLSFGPFPGHRSPDVTRFALTLEDGSLSYDPATGTLSGQVPEVEAPAGESGGRLAAGGLVSRPVDCDGPSRCVVGSFDRFQVERAARISE